jgi:sulfatase modifying factor 1
VCQLKINTCMPLPVLTALFAASLLVDHSPASTNKDPSVTITTAYPSNTITWNTVTTGPADVEYSPDLSNWTKVSTDNSIGHFSHSVGSAIMGFYRLRWSPNNLPLFISVEGGALPPASFLAGTIVKTFQIGKYEVTWGEWQSVRSWAVTNGYADLSEGSTNEAGIPPGRGSASDHPVRNVNWYDVLKWSNARSERDGLTPVYQIDGETYRNGQTVPAINESANGYRLPSEAEWEWAARGGVNSQGYAYSGSNDPNAVAWHEGNSIGAPVIIDSRRGTWPVGQKTGNELGIHDMSGNVWEWCIDWVQGTNRRIRGGGWNHLAGVCEVRYRGNDSTLEIRRKDLGFRSARSLMP